MFLAPLTAWMQDRYPAAKRGELQSAVNLQDCIAGMLAVLVIAIFEYGGKVFGISTPRSIFGSNRFVAIVCVVS